MRSSKIFWLVTGLEQVGKLRNNLLEKCKAQKLPYFGMKITNLTKCRPRVFVSLLNI